MIDGGGLVTLCGGGKRRILYMDTCDPAQVWTTSHCQNQSTPRLTVQNITFTNGNSTGQTYEGGGGGAIFDRGGRFKVVNSRVRRQPLRHHRPRPRRRRDPGAQPVQQRAGLRREQHVHRRRLLQRRRPVQHRRLVDGAQLRVHRQQGDRQRRESGHERAHRAAAAAPRSTTTATRTTLTIAGTVIENNNANEGGGAIFYVSNDRTGTMSIANSTLTHNHSGKFQNYPGIFFLGAHAPTFSHSTIK